MLSARVLGIQINDAPAQAEADLIDETLHRRLAPGDGDIENKGDSPSVRRRGSTPSQAWPAAGHDAASTQFGAAHSGSAPS
jgi:hypothetical protein